MNYFFKMTCILPPYTATIGTTSHMLHSEQISKLNKALKHCDQLKNNLQASILHVQMLNSKYNSKEALEKDKLYGISMIDVDDDDDDDVDHSSGSSSGSRSRSASTSLGSNTPRRSIQMECNTSTPDKLNRSLHDIKQINNNIIVRGIKVRRELETVMTQLKHTTAHLMRDERTHMSPFKRRWSMSQSVYSPLARRTMSPMPSCSSHRCGCLDTTMSPAYNSRESLYSNKSTKLSGRNLYKSPRDAFYSTLSSSLHSCLSKSLSYESKLRDLSSSLNSSLMSSRESLNASYKYSTPVNRRLLIETHRMQAQRSC